MTDVAPLKDKLEQAIATGRERGVDTSAWEQKLNLLVQAQKVAAQTGRLLLRRGWCLWQCARLNGDIIAVVRDDSVTGIPPGYALYTEDELQRLCQAKSSTLRLIHEAKKLAGAKVTAVQEGKR